MKVYKNISELIGNTPLLEINNISKLEGVKGRILVKLEYLNPAGSVKDRTALFMLDDAEKRGVITKGATIIEPTSGNTGIGLSAIGASRGYKVILTMPDTMSKERIKILQAYGAEVVLTRGSEGMKGAIEKANEIRKNTPNSFIPSQFDNPANALSHEMTTAREIWADTDGRVDFFVAGIGTGGTLSGTGRFLKSQNQNIQIVGVEPMSSPLITKGVSGSHKIQGIGANFIPENYDKNVVDEVVAVSDEEAYRCAKLMAKLEGILVGISSGAALSATLTLAKKEENNGKTFVVILPDTGDRYLSTDLFD